MVQLVDEVLVVLHHLSAFELEGGGEHAVVGGEFILDEGETLDLLEASDPT